MAAGLLLRWSLAALCAYFVKGLCGFADTLVFTSLLSVSGTPNIDISPVTLLIAFPANAFIAAKERKRIRWKVVLPALIPVLLGDIPGILLLKGASPRILTAVCGAVIILVGVEMLLRTAGRLRIRESKAGLVCLCLLSGVFSGLFGIGALLSAYVSRVTEDSRSFKANLCAIFLGEEIFRAALYLILGILTTESLRWTAIALPAAAVGLLLGLRAVKKTDEKKARGVVTAALIFSGVLMILKTFL